MRSRSAVSALLLFPRSQAGKAQEAHSWATGAAELGTSVSKNSSASHFLSNAIPFDIEEKKNDTALKHAIDAAEGFASGQPLELSPELKAERQQENISPPPRLNNQFSHFAPINLGLIPVFSDIAARGDGNWGQTRESRTDQVVEYFPHQSSSFGERDIEGVPQPSPASHG
jgi:hypothetical protein